MPRVARGGPGIELRGLRGSGRTRGAVLALNGATSPEVRRAAALAGDLCGRWLLVAVDGGLRSCRAARRRPDLFVGDGDSAGRLPRDIPTVVFPEDKDFSDLSGALREVKRRGVRVVVVAGLLGGRVDHEWANIMEAGARSGSFAAILAPTARGIVVVTRRGCRMATRPGRSVSLFVLGGAATVTLRGARWSLNRRRVTPGSRGLSNLTGARIDLIVHAGAVALVFPRSAGRDRR